MPYYFSEFPNYLVEKILKLEEEEIYVRVDIHIKTWYVTVRTAEIELFKGAIEGKWEQVRNILEKYKGKKTIVVYEAEYFGYWLHGSSPLNRGRDKKHKIEDNLRKLLAVSY